MLGELLLGLLSLLTLAYLWVFSNFTYWKRKGVPQHPWTFWAKSTIEVLLMRTSFPTIYNQIYSEYPNNDVVGVYGVYQPKLLIRNPTLVKRVMVSDFSSFHDNEFYVTKKNDPHFALDPFCLRGDEWKPYRNKLTYYLAAGKVKEIYPLMRDIVPKLDSYIDSVKGEEIDAKELVSLFFMDNISNNVLGVNSNCFTDPDSDFRKMADLQMKDALQTWWNVMIMTNLPKLRDIIGISFIPKSVSDYLENLLKEVFRYRKENNISRNDLFQHIMKKELGTNEDNLSDFFFVGVTFFLEGFESSAMTAAPILYELAVNPDIQERLHQELEDTLGDKFDPDFETLHNGLPYLHQIVHESGRLYPSLFDFRRVCTKPTTLDVHGESLHIQPGIVKAAEINLMLYLYDIRRLCTKPTTLDANGESVHVQPGIVALLPAFSLQRDPQHYPDPEQFNPDRFSDQGTNITPFTHLPFGEGPRMCPGVKFAQSQVKLLIANIVYKYKILRTAKTPSKITFSNNSFLAIPQETMWISLQRRN